MDTARIQVALLVALAVLVSKPALAQQSDRSTGTRTYLFVAEPSFKSTTPYRRMTGLWGAATGHWSAGDEINVIENAQMQLVRDLGLAKVDLKKVTFLPAEITECLPRLVDARDRTKEGWFGKKTTHTYGQFKAEGRVRLAFLHSGELNLPGWERHEVKGARLELSETHGTRYPSCRTVGEVEVPLSRLKLGAFTKETAMDKGRLCVAGSVPESYCYTLADRVKERKALKDMNLAAVVNLDLANGHGAQRVTLQRGNRLFANSDLLKALKIKGARRFFSKGFYRHKLRTSLAKAKKRVAR